MNDEQSVSSGVSLSTSERIKKKNDTKVNTYISLLRLSQELAKNNNTHIESLLLTISYYCITVLTYRILPWNGSMNWVNLLSDYTWRYPVIASSDLFSSHIPAQEVFLIFAWAYILLLLGLLIYNGLQGYRGATKNMKFLKIMCFLTQLLRYVLSISMVSLCGSLLLFQHRDTGCSEPRSILVISSALILLFIIIILSLFSAFSLFCASPTKSNIAQSTNRHQIMLSLFIFTETLTEVFTSNTEHLVLINCVLSFTTGFVAIILLFYFFPFYNRIQNFFAIASIGCALGTKLSEFILLIVSFTRKDFDFESWIPFVVMISSSLTAGMTSFVLAMLYLRKIFQRSEGSIWERDIRLRMLAWRSNGISLKVRKLPVKNDNMHSEYPVLDDPVAIEYENSLREKDSNPILLINYATYLFGKAAEIQPQISKRDEPSAIKPSDSGRGYWITNPNDEPVTRAESQENSIYQHACDLAKLKLKQAQSMKQPVDVALLLLARLNYFGEQYDAERLEMQKMLKTASGQEDRSRHIKHVFWTSLARKDLNVKVISNIMTETWRAENNAHKIYQRLLLAFPSNPTVLRATANFLSEFKGENFESDRLINEAEEIEEAYDSGAQVNAVPYSESVGRGSIGSSEFGRRSATINSKSSKRQRENSSSAQLDESIERDTTNTWNHSSNNLIQSREEAGIRKRLGKCSNKVTMFKFFWFLLFVSIIGALIATIIIIERMRQVFNDQSQAMFPTFKLRIITDAAPLSFSTLSLLYLTNSLKFRESNETKIIYKDISRADNLLDSYFGSVLFYNQQYAKHIDELTYSAPSSGDFLDLWLRESSTQIEYWRDKQEIFSQQDATLREAVYFFRNALSDITKKLNETRYNLNIEEDSMWKFIMKNSLSNLEPSMAKLTEYAIDNFKYSIHTNLVLGASTFVAVIGGTFLFLAGMTSLILISIRYEDNTAIKVFRFVPKKSISKQVKTLRPFIEKEQADSLKSELNSSMSLKRKTIIQFSILLILIFLLILSSSIIQFAFSDYLKAYPQAIHALGDSNYHLTRSLHFAIRRLREKIFTDLDSSEFLNSQFENLTQEVNRRRNLFGERLRTFKYGSDSSLWDGAMGTFPESLFEVPDLSNPSFYCGDGNDPTIALSAEDQLERLSEEPSVENCYGLNQLEFEFTRVHEALADLTNSIDLRENNMDKDTLKSLNSSILIAEDVQKIISSDFKFGELFFHELNNEREYVLNISVGVFLMVTIFLVPWILIYFVFELNMRSTELQEERRQILRYLLHLSKDEINQCPVVKQFLLTGEFAMDIAKEANKSFKKGAMSLLSASDDGVIVFDESGMIIEINSAAQKIFGTSMESTIGSSITELIVDSPNKGSNDFENGIELSEKEKTSSFTQFIKFNIENSIKLSSNSSSSEPSQGNNRNIFNSRTATHQSSHIYQMRPGSSFTRELVLYRTDKSNFPARVSLSCSEVEEKRMYGMFIKDLTEEKLRQKLFTAEKEKSESLLLNILPSGIARRLKAGETDISEEYPNCTVGFLDMVSFTPLSSNIAARDLVAYLNLIFSIFDVLCEKWGVEKVKTIGDAYMAVSSKTEHALCALSAIWEMITVTKLILCEYPSLEVIKDILDNDPPDSAQIVADQNKTHDEDSGKSQATDEYRMNILNQAMKASRTVAPNNNPSFRAGINSGKIVGGVIGRKKFQYDIWGDTVNIASRMESTGVAGVVQVSRSTYELTHESFDFEERQIQVKGKGNMTVYICKKPKSQHPYYTKFHKSLARGEIKNVEVREVANQIEGEAVEDLSK